MTELLAYKRVVRVIRAFLINEVRYIHLSEGSKRIIHYRNNAVEHELFLVVALQLGLTEKASHTRQRNPSISVSVGWVLQGGKKKHTSLLISTTKIPRRISVFMP